MIEKRSKNSIQWLGAGPGCNAREVTDQLLALKEELVDLENKEMELDQHFAWAKQSIHNIMDDTNNKSVSYVKQEDLCKLHPDSTLLVIQAPSGTSLEVPAVDMDTLHDSQNVYGRVNERKNKKKFQMHLKSRYGPISVFLVNQQDGAKATVATITSGTATGPEANQQAIAPVTSEAAEVAKDLETVSSSDKPVTSGKAASAVTPAPVKVEVSVRGTRSSSRVCRESATREKSEKLSSSTATTSAPVPSPVVAPVTAASKPAAPTGLRQLSPRKAAQNHSILKNCSVRSNIMSKHNEPEDDVLSDEKTGIDENKAINNTGPAPKRMRRLSEYLSMIEHEVIPDVQQALVRLSPPPNARDYNFNLDVDEGAADLFDSLTN